MYFTIRNVLDLPLMTSFYFRARATNTQLGQDENSEFVELEVYGEDGADVSPEILFPPKDTVIVKGSRQTELQCIANARPLLEMELVWMKDGRPLEDAEIPFSFNDLWNRTLSLFQADAAHAGVYTCTVRMRTGGPMITREAKVTVVGKSSKVHLTRRLAVSREHSPYLGEGSLLVSPKFTFCLVIFFF